MEANKEFVCKNCNTSLNEEDLFCPHCGQRTHLGRLTLKEILSDFFSSVFNLDAPFPKTLIRMFLHPHTIVKEFVDGKRKSYYAPVKYMVLCLFLNILIGELIGFDPIDNQRTIDHRELDEVSLRYYEAGRFLSKNLNYFMFLLPFSIAIFSKLFFWRSRFNFAERSALGFYLAGQFIVLALIPIFLSKLEPKLFHLMYPIALFYFVFAFYKFFEMQSKFLRFFLALFTSFFAYFGYIAVSFIIAYNIFINS